MAEMQIPRRARINRRRSDLPRQARATSARASAGAAGTAAISARSNAVSARAGAAPRGGVGPIVKWAGGKTRLLDQLVARAPDRYRRYFEPFLGGAALFFRLAPRLPVLSDSNTDLINVYRCVANHVEAVIVRLEAHRAAHSDEYYYQMRERWNQPGGLSADVNRAAAFIYLNKTCYNGLWRVNSRGKFNVPVGRYESPSILDAGGLRAASMLLCRAELRTASFDQAVAEVSAGDFVYFDPPYHPLSDTARFTSYTAESFGPEDQRQLAEVARRLMLRGATVLVSNSDTQFVRDLYRGFDIDVVNCPRAINSKAGKRGPQRELLIRGGRK